MRAVFSFDNARLAGCVQNFADSAARDIAALQAAIDDKQVRAFAHRLKGAARVAGATLMAEQAARVEAAAEDHDLAAARYAAASMEQLLADTLKAMRSIA